MLSYPSSSSTSHKCKQAKIKMKFLVVLAFVFAVAAAAPANLDNPDALATIVEQNADIDPQGNFQYS